MELIYNSTLKFYDIIFKNINDTFEFLNDNSNIEVISDSKLEYPYFKVKSNRITFKDNLSELLEYLEPEEASSIVLNRILDGLELILGSKLDLPNFNEQFKEFKRSLNRTVFYGRSLNPFLLNNLYEENLVSLQNKQYKNMKTYITFSRNSPINFRFKDFSDEFNQVDPQINLFHIIKNVLNHSLEKQYSNEFKPSNLEVSQKLQRLLTPHTNWIYNSKIAIKKLDLTFTRKDIINTLESTTSLNFKEDAEKSKFFNRFSKIIPKGKYTFKDLLIITTITFFREKYRLNNSNNASFSNSYFATLYTSSFVNKKTNEILKSYKSASTFDTNSSLKSEFNESIFQFQKDITDYLHNKLEISKDNKTYYNYQKNIKQHLEPHITYLIYEIFYLNSLPYYEFLIITLRDYENFISNNLYILNQNNPTKLLILANKLQTIFTDWSKSLDKADSNAFNTNGITSPNNLMSLNLTLNNETSYSFLKVLRLLEKNNFRKDFYNK